MKRVPRLQDGFSLLELMVAVSIVAIMMGILTPYLMGASNRAQTTVCQGNIRTISAALAEYDLIHQTLPTGNTTQQIGSLVSDNLVTNDALSANYTINDTDPNDIQVSCPSG